MTRIERLLAATLITAALAGCGLGGPAQPLFTVKGLVRDDAGKPLPGVVVTDGQVSALSDESGHFSLSVFAKRLTFVKPGKRRTTRDIEQGDSPTQTMQPGSPALRVGLDARGAAAGIQGLSTALARDVEALSPYPGTPISALDALVMLTPGPLSDSELLAIDAWLHAGGRLVLCGEWGGYGAQSLDTLNHLAVPAGITYTGGTVKLVDNGDPDTEWIGATTVDPPSLAGLVGGGEVALFTAGSLAVAGAARAILATDRRGYTVLAGRVGPQVLAAVGASGAGKVFCLSDSSLWLDEDSNGDGEPNVEKGANSRLPIALLKW